MTDKEVIKYMADRIERAIGHSYGWETDGIRPSCRYCTAHSHDGHDDDCRVRDMEEPLYQALLAAEKALKENK